MPIRTMNERDWGHLRRKHVDAMDWGDNVGTDYWYFAGSATNGATTFLLSSRGWTTTSLTLGAGSGGDFMASGDKGTPRNAAQNAQNDLIQSPQIFGDYTHARIAQIIMREKQLPRYLICDAFATFSVVANNENTTALGFVEAAGSIVTANDAMAVVVSDATNWVGRSGSDSVTGGTAVDTNPHWFRIILDRGSATSAAITDGARLYVDGVSQGTFDIQADLAPFSFGAGSGGANNLVQLHVAHIYYEWDLRNVDQLTV